MGDFERLLAQFRCPECDSKETMKRLQPGLLVFWCRSCGYQHEYFYKTEALMEDHCRGCKDEENELCYECGYCIDCCTCGPEAWEKDDEE